jgi:hypothetical protein
MDERILVITDGIKGMNNAAVDLVMKGEYDDAERMFGSIESTARLFQYGGGIGMARMSLANLSVMRGDVMGALEHIEVAEEYYPPGNERDAACGLHKKIAFMALEIGIRKERAGDLGGALELFERIVGHLNEKRSALVAREIENIKRHLNGKK